MVSKELILKTLNESIIKCRKPSYSIINISNHVKGALNSFARNTKNEPIEHGVIIDGHGNSIVEAEGNEYSVNIHTETTISKILEEKCKDILEDYQKEYDSITNENDKIFLRDKYERKIYERIESLGADAQFHIDHNHPGAYANAELDYNVFTSLSLPDLKNCLVRGYIGMGVADGGFFIDNIVKSKTAECSNGSRMTLVNNNPPNVMVNSEKFTKASNNLYDSWNDYYDAIKSEALHYAKNTLVKKYGEEKVRLDRDNLKTEVGKEVNDYIKKRSMELFPKMIKGNIQEFKELGFDLRIDWL